MRDYRVRANGGSACKVVGTDIGSGAHDRIVGADRIGEARGSTQKSVVAALRVEQPRLDAEEAVVGSARIIIAGLLTD